MWTITSLFYQINIFLKIPISNVYFGSFAKLKQNKTAVCSIQRQNLLSVNWLSSIHYDTLNNNAMTKKSRTYNTWQTGTLSRKNHESFSCLYNKLDKTIMKAANCKTKTKKQIFFSLLNLLPFITQNLGFSFCFIVVWNLVFIQFCWNQRHLICLVVKMKVALLALRSSPAFSLPLKFVRDLILYLRI